MERPPLYSKVSYSKPQGNAAYLLFVVVSKATCCWRSERKRSKGDKKKEIHNRTKQDVIAILSAPLYSKKGIPLLPFMWHHSRPFSFSSCIVQRASCDQLIVVTAEK
ncbi:hypothetical protein TNCT_136411 [Trichonephila clavata]|uniref:Uncharacterized protein n=1 Tax=Trichonephila clavata TaxID=2740835 RepID=A0A8X6GKD5_TRICU|nr:hypothetical protein TNCT_136411 [Trichonephila clavata]